MIYKSGYVLFKQTETIFKAIYYYYYYFFKWHFSDTALVDKDSSRRMALLVFSLSPLLFE